MDTAKNQDWSFFGKTISVRANEKKKQAPKARRCDSITVETITSPFTHSLKGLLSHLKNHKAWKMSKSNTFSKNKFFDSTL